MWIAVGLLLVYFAVMLGLWFWRQRAGQVAVLLQVAAECPPAELEWIVYSFRRFLARELPGAVWWVVSSRPEQQEVLLKLAGRFAYRTAECYNQEKNVTLWRFSAGSAFSAAEWPAELLRQSEERKAGSKNDGNPGWQTFA